MKVLPEISLHARDRFLERLQKNHPDFTGDASKLLLKLLKQATPIAAINPITLLNRLQRSQQPVQYFHAAGWRFVVADDEESNKRKLITVERVNKWEN